MKYEVGKLYRLRFHPRYWGEFHGEPILKEKYGFEEYEVALLSDIVDLQFHFVFQSNLKTFSVDGIGKERKAILHAEKLN